MNKTIKWVGAAFVTFAMVGAWAANSGGFCERGEHGERMVKKITKKLDLNTEQQAQLGNLQSKVKDKMQGMQTARKDNMQNFQALFGERFDQAGALSLVQKKSATMNEHAPEMITAFAGFYDSLDQKQQAKLAKMAKKRGRGPMGFGLFGKRGHHGSDHDEQHDDDHERQEGKHQG